MSVHAQFDNDRLPGTVREVERGLFEHPADPRYAEAVTADPHHRWTRLEQITKCTEWGDAVGRPGEKFSYSDTGYIILGGIIEKTTGQNLGSAVRDLLDFDRLGLNATWWEILEARPTGAGMLYHRWVGALRSMLTGKLNVVYAAPGLVWLTGEGLLMQPSSVTANSALEDLYNRITGDEDARVCKDIPSESCNDQPRNFFAYLGANTLNKVADEMSSARLVLPWMLGALGAPTVFTGFLVPIREAGVLLPQMAVAAAVRHMPRRQPVWLLGALLSGLALFGMAATAVLLDGAAAGWATVTMLVVFSLARGLCSVSAKDVLGKTVSKTRRGALMGYSAAAAGVATLWLGRAPTPADRATVDRVALIASLVCCALLHRHRGDNLHMSSTWLCSRSDVIASVGVQLAAAAAYLIAARRPDVLTAALSPVSLCTRPLT